MPAIPRQIDQDPQPLGQLPNGEMGTLATDSVSTSLAYGVLATRFNALRSLYNCVREQMNAHQTPEGCVDDAR